MLTLQKTRPGHGGLELVQRAPPEAGPGEIRIEVRAAGLCGTDMQIYKWAPRMARRMALPRTLGHEVSGIVDQAGPGVEHVRPGDHVVLESHIFCGHCAQCLRDQAHLCAHTRYPGIDIDGGFARYIVVPARIAWVVAQPLDHTVAAMLEPFGIAVHACLEGGGVGGRTVFVNGCGPIGLMAVAAARALGARKVFACDLHPLRLAAAGRMGADAAFDATDGAVAEAVRQATGGLGADVTIEFSGSAAGFATAFDATAKGGDLRLVGAPPEPVAVDFTQWLLKCPTVRNIHGRRIWHTWQAALPLVTEGRVDLAPLASHVLPLEDGLRGFELAERGQALKPILCPQ